MRNFLLLVCYLLAVCQAQAQKKPLDHSVYDSWQSITAPQISDRGQVLTYLISPQQGDTTLVIRWNRNGRELRIPRGCKARISRDERFVICTIKPLFDVVRQARIKKEPKPKRSPRIRWLSSVCRAGRSRNSAMSRRLVLRQEAGRLWLFCHPTPP